MRAAATGTVLDSPPAAPPPPPAPGASEVRRGVRRIAANYLRLATTLALGLLLHPLLVGGVGPEAYGLWGLIGATAGIAEMFREIVRESMYRELGDAWHDPDPQRFKEAYNASLVLCAGLALATAAVFGIVLIALRWFSIPPDLMGPARLVVLAMGAITCATVLLAPQFNMYVVTERMGLYNFWTALDRSAYTLVAATLFLGVGFDDPGRALVAFAFGSAALVGAILLASVALIVKLEPRLVPRPSSMTLPALRAILRTGAWNGVVVVAMNLHIRVDQLIMNLAFGLFGNSVFTIAVTLTGYVRMLATGVTDGLEAVSVRLSRTGAPGGIASLAEHSARLHAAVALPAGAAVFILARPLLDLWMAPRVDDPAVIEHATLVVRVLTVGFTCRAVSDSWVRILYGAGHVRKYAPLILFGGLCNPLLAGALLLMLPDHLAITAPAAAYSAILLCIHLLGIPWIAARCLNTSYHAVLRPLLRPLLASAAAVAPLLWAAANVQHWSLLALALAGAASGSLYALTAFFFVLRPDERRRLAALAGIARPAAAGPEIGGAPAEPDREPSV